MSSKFFRKSALELGTWVPTAEKKKKKAFGGGEKDDIFKRKKGNKVIHDD